MYTFYALIHVCTWTYIHQWPVLKKAGRQIFMISENFFGLKKKNHFFWKTEPWFEPRLGAVLATVLIRKDLNGLFSRLGLLSHLSAGFSPVSLPKHKLSNAKLWKWEGKDWLPPPCIFPFVTSLNIARWARSLLSLALLFLPPFNLRLPRSLRPVYTNATETHPRISDKQ